MDMSERYQRPWRCLCCLGEHWSDEEVAACHVNHGIYSDSRWPLTLEQLEQSLRDLKPLKGLN